ncbi:MAG: hypothetical protein P4N41_06740 [Negativicutes bacterium]|nr:hypothetical protein [Negativicutes bacterium]
MMNIKGAEGIKPEVLAAIAAAVGVTMEEPDIEMVAAVAAAIVHAGRGGLAVRIKRTNNAWAAFGREKIMNSRF